MSVDYHRHCQATVLGATGDPHNEGLTWSDIRDLSLPNIEARVPQWLEYFSRNDNMTEDLAAILKLIDATAVAQQGGGGGFGRWNLVYYTNNGDLICQG